MSGRAIILLVSGIIIISGTILYRIEAASTSIVANSTSYYKNQSARNIAETGVNLALRQLSLNNTWRTGFTALDMFDGSATVTVFDTSYAGVVNAIGVRSVATYGASVATSAAFCFFPQPLLPPDVKSLLTLNGPNQINGNITIDARDHDIFDAVNFNSGKGTYGVWTTSPTFTPGGSSSIGGTVSSVDFAPAGSPGPGVVQTSQSYPGGFPTTPDSAFGGPSAGYTEGTLMSIAKSGIQGSQYATNPSKLKYPLSGVTYVEMPVGSPLWLPANINGTGILIVHNSAGTAGMKNPGGSFAGIIVVDDLIHFHGNLWGAIIVLTTSPSGNVLGNGSANMFYSRQAILKVAGLLANGAHLNVIAWWD